MNSRERRAALTMESFAYNGCLSGDMHPMTWDGSVNDEDREHLPSSQVEIMIEKGLQTHTVCRVYYCLYMFRSRDCSVQEAVAHTSRAASFGLYTTYTDWV